MPRDSSGNYTLPLGNPVIDGTIIDVDWANPTMADIAVQLNNLLTRDGLLGPILPFKLVDGNLANPGLSFSAEPGMGLYRKALNTAAFVSDGTEVALFKNNLFSVGVPATFASTLGVTGALTVGSNLTVGGTLSITGTTTFTGTTAFPPGTSALPGIYFTGDNSTGFYSTGTGHLGFATVGLGRVSIDSTGSMFIAAPTNPSTPCLSMICAAGAFGIDIRGRSSDNAAVIRLLKNDYTAENFKIQADTANVVIGTTNAIPVGLYTSSVLRMTITAGGSVGVGPNVPSQLFEVQGVSGSKIQLLNLSDVGRGGFLAATTGSGFMVSSNSGVYPLLLGVDSVEGARLTTGTPRLIVGGSSLPGTGTYNGLLGVTTANSSNCAVEVHSVGGNNLRMAMFANSNNGLMGWDMSYSAGFLGYVWNVVGTERMRLTVGGELGVNCTPPATVSLRVQQAGANDVGVEWQRTTSTTGSWLTYNRNGGSYGNQTYDALMHQWNVSGTNTLKFNAPGANILELVDVTASGANIKMTGNGATTPAKFIRATSGNFEIVNNAYSAVIWQLTDAGNMTAFGRAFLRQGISGTDFDPAVGPTGNNTSTNCPIGSIVMANVGAIVVNAFATINAATNNLTVTATGAGTNSVISSGTWRNLGARDTSTGFALWQRTA